MAEGGIDLAETGRALRRDGFCKLSGILDEVQLGQLRAAADACGERWSSRIGDEVMRAPGSMVQVRHMLDPIFAEVILNPRAAAALDAMDLPERAFTDGYIISKPPRSPRLFWHFDWFGWDDESAYAVEPPQMFVMYYTSDTTPENGCLRVIPGSHLRRHPLHDLMADGHRALRSAGDMNRPEFAPWPDEVDVPVRAGDAVVGDARLLHAAHGNDTDVRRSLLTLWFHPRFAALPSRVRATLAARAAVLPDEWPADLRAEIQRLQPPPIEGVEPLVRTTAGPRPASVSP